jgi:hypothetical protein
LKESPENPGRFKRRYPSPTYPTRGSPPSQQIGSHPGGWVPTLLRSQKTFKLDAVTDKAWDVPHWIGKTSRVFRTAPVLGVLTSSPQTRHISPVPGQRALAGRFYSRA